MFAVAHLLNDRSLRDLGWAQVDFVFGVNPVGAHLGHKSEERVKLNGFWEGVEEGWPQAHPDGYGRLGLVRGTLEGTPLNDQFPIAKAIEKTVGSNEGQVFGKNAYATEGWCISNRGWQATVTFATLGTTSLKLFDENYRNEIKKAKPGQTVIVELRAALNQDWNTIDRGWVEINDGSGKTARLGVTETGANTGIFTGKCVVPKMGKGTGLKVSYGFFGFDTCVVLNTL
jgi:hypothetical protein